MVREERLRNRLVPREHQPSRVASRVRDPQQLEVTHDVLVKGAHFVKRFEHVERDVRLSLFDGPADDP